ncbi:MAG: extracellular solute-binding protein, partial [Clostridia bacterium]|nr:extracellular solute-binding protein [Clostridia bacterium]
MKRLFACLLSLLLLVGCSLSGVAESAGTTLFPTDENGYPDLGGVTITIWMPFDSNTAEYATSYGELKIIQKLEEMLNVNLEFMHPPVGSETEGFSTMLASGEYPDIIWNDYVKKHYQGGVAMAYDDGLIWDYTELVSPETTPNYWEKVMEQPYMARQAVDDEGRNVGLGAQVSGSEESTTCMWGLMIRQDLLDEAGLEVPVTLDDWTEMLRTFKEMGVKYPLLLNKSGYWRSRNAFSGAYNVDTRDFNLTEDGGVEYGPATEGYKEMLKYVHTWYSEGLINPDFTTDTQADTWSMLAN